MIFNFQQLYKFHFSTLLKVLLQFGAYDGRNYFGIYMVMCTGGVGLSITRWLFLISIVSAENHFITITECALNALNQWRVYAFSTFLSPLLCPSPNSSVCVLHFFTLMIQPISPNKSLTFQKVKMKLKTYLSHFGVHLMSQTRDT